VSRVGEMLGLSTENAAKGIIDIANEVMLGALRVITVERGLDPRTFGIVAFGGAGPLHANALAELLGCYPVLVPANPGVLSAQGFLEADFKNEFVRTFIRSTVGLDPKEVWSHVRILGRKAEAWLAEEGVRDHEKIVRYSVDLRYEQQGFEVTVDLVESMVASGSSLDAVLDDFHALHERLYGVRFSVPVELVALRVIASGVSASVEPLVPASAVSGGAARIMETRPAFFDRAWVDTPHYDRASMALGGSVEGPAIIRQYDTTIVLLPRHYAEVDPSGNLLIWPLSRRTHHHG
jgi:N-methylhydantoinase A